MFAQTTESIINVDTSRRTCISGHTTETWPTHRGHLRFELIQCEALTEEISLMVKRNRATSGP